MDIGWMLDMKMKIGSKILITYFIILVLAFFITGLAFNILSKIYLIKETRQQLIEEGNELARVLKTTQLQRTNLNSVMLTRSQLKIAGRFIDSQVLIFNKDMKLVYRDINDIEDKEILKQLRNGQTDIQGYVSEIVPVYTQSKQIKGYIFLMTELKNIRELNSIMRRTEILSFLIAGIIAISIGLFLKNSLTNPIKKLSEKMIDFSITEFEEYPPVVTGDEIEDLDKSFRSMVTRIKNYDEQQKMFLQNTSHELKTPLMSIQGYAEAIKDGIVEGEEVNKSLDIIIEESQKLKRTVDDIIYLTKLGNISESFYFEQVKLNDVINEAIRKIKPIADNNGIAISMKIDYEHTGTFDKEKITEAILNILSNAIRYTDSIIEVSMEKNRDKLEITVADDGDGFKAGEEDKVFERFYKGNKGNTGIGLSITKAIIEGHNGKIIAFNNKPKGAVFKITLPI